jgi:hypothetical protein
MCSQEDLAKAAMHWMANNTGYLQTAIEDLSDGEFTTLVSEVVDVGESSTIIEAITTVRENACEPDETGLDEILKYRRALLKELAWADSRKKELMAELHKEYPEEKVTKVVTRRK